LAGWPTAAVSSPSYAAIAALEAMELSEQVGRRGTVRTTAP
jgi:hypothetical protein